MRALLLIAHGSRQPESNRAVAALVERLAERAGGRFERVRHAFLELAEPAVDGVVEALVGEGVTELVVVPYFLSPGRHLQEDIPNLIRRIRGRYPGVSVRLVPAPGAAEEMVDLLIELAGGQP